MMIRQLHGLVEKENGMHCIIKKFNALFLCLFFTAYADTSFDLTLISFDQCKKQSCNLEKKMTRHHVLNACLTTAATVYAAYNFCIFLNPTFFDHSHNSNNTVNQHVAEPPVQVKQDTFTWLRDTIWGSGCSLAKVCGQHIFATWLIKQAMPDFSAKSFIKEHISLKEHAVAIEALLKKLPDSEDECRERNLFLIRAHFQKIVNKIECLMAYLLAYSRYHGIKSSEVENFVQLTCDVVARDVTLFNQHSSADRVFACNTLLSALTTLLNSSVTYALCAMPTDLA